MFCDPPCVANLPPGDLRRRSAIRRFSQGTHRPLRSEEEGELSKVLGSTDSAYANFRKNLSQRRDGAAG